MSEPARFWDYGSLLPLTASIRKGDVLSVSFWARRITTTKESGEAEVQVALMQKQSTQEVRPLERRVSVGTKWTHFVLPFKIDNDSEIGMANLGFRFGYKPQSLEIGGVQLLNYGANVKVSDLPKTLIRYEGWASDAPWRRAATERIEKYRKGEIRVSVLDAFGKPVRNAALQVRMKRHAFGWGAQVDARDLTDTDNNSARTREIVETYFNKVVFGNDFKWGRWFGNDPKDRFGKPEALAALPWLQARQIQFRGHVMMWPSWRATPLFLQELKDDPIAMRKSILDHIAAQTSAVTGRVNDWDVINETFAHHDVLDLLGRDVMVDWFRAAKKGAPQTRLFYNDYTMFQPGEGQNYFYNTIKELKDKGAPIDAIGEQGHFSSSPLGIPDILATLDKFSTLNLPISITEFDIDTDDQDLQADFMRDFTTAVFSHPAVTDMVHWGITEANRGPQWAPRAAMWDQNWNLRPHGKVWTDLITKTWWTNADGVTNSKGIYSTRGFYGDYQITVVSKGKKQTTNFRITPQNIEQVKIVLR